VQVVYASRVTASIALVLIESRDYSRELNMNEHILCFFYQSSCVIRHGVDCKRHQCHVTITRSQVDHRPRWNGELGDFLVTWQPIIIIIMIIFNTELGTRENQKMNHNAHRWNLVSGSQGQTTYKWPGSMSVHTSWTGGGSTIWRHSYDVLIHVELGLLAMLTAWLQEPSIYTVRRFRNFS